MIRLSLKVKSSASSNGFAKFGVTRESSLNLAGRRKRHVPLESNGNYHKGPVLPVSGHHGVSVSPFDSSPLAGSLAWGTSVKYASRKRMIGIGVAWLAAYALVLNVILSSVLHAAALSPLTWAGGHILCANSADISVVRDDAGKSDKRAPAHCPLCVSNHSTAALPPPPFPVLLERVPSRTQSVVASGDIFVALARFSDHQARGPPGLI